MTTILSIDDELLQEAQKLEGYKTKEAAVTAALEEYIRPIKQLEILELFGKIDYDGDYDYKKARNCDPCL
jgi:Arc/MetJ family transcription regulator